NPWLESRYNRDGPEPPTYVPYRFLGRRSYEFPPLQESEEIDLTKVKPETREAVDHIVADKLGRPLTQAEEAAETTFDQLGLDSLDRMDMMLRTEQQFGFSGEVVPATLGELWALAQGLARRGESKPAPPAWFRPPSDTGPLQFLGESVPEAFVNRVRACPKDV